MRSTPLALIGSSRADPSYSLVDCGVQSVELRCFAGSPSFVPLLSPVGSGRPCDRGRRRLLSRATPLPGDSSRTMAALSAFKEAAAALLRHSPPSVATRGTIPERNVMTATWYPAMAATNTASMARNDFGPAATGCWSRANNATMVIGEPATGALARAA